MINRVILIGRIGKAPDTRYTPDGLAITKFSIATTERRKGKDGNYHDHTDWHQIVAFGKLGEICGEYLSKGRQAFIEGKINYGSYEKDGRTVYTTSIIANQMRVLGDKPSGANKKAGQGIQAP